MAPRQDWDPPIGARVLDERRLAGEPEDLIFGPHPAYNTFTMPKAYGGKFLAPVLWATRPDTVDPRGPKGK